MAKQSSLLSHIQIAAPCPASWDKMEGNSRVRFCTECKLNVYNLSEMSTKAAEQLILEKEGKLCVRMYKRKDGTIITENCPVGLRWIRDRIKFARILAVSCFSWIISLCRVQGQELQERVSIEYQSSPAVQDFAYNSDCSEVLVLTKQLPRRSASDLYNPVNAASNAETIVFSEPNARISRNGNSLELKNGKVVLLTTKHEESLRFQFGTIKIPTNSCVIVEASLGTRIRIANLLGTELPSTYVGMNGKEMTLTSMAGEEICISTELGSHDDLIPFDGVDREPILGSVTPDIEIRGSKFDRAMMFEKSLLNYTNETPKGIRRWVSRVKKKILAETHSNRDLFPPKPLMELPPPPLKHGKKK